VQFPQGISGLVMLAGVSHPWEGGIDPLYKVTGHPLGAALLVPVLTAWVPKGYVRRAIEEVFAPQTAPDGYAAHFGPDMTLRRQTLRVNARERVGLEAQVTALSPRYPGLSLPLEIVHGGADVTVGVHVHAIPLQRDVPGAALTVLEGIGHMPHHAAPKAVADAIDRAAIRAGLR
jgi:pimeloyl-ACP methyl ester carboxylesterase